MAPKPKVLLGRAAGRESLLKGLVVRHMERKSEWEEGREHQRILEEILEGHRQGAEKLAWPKGHTHSLPIQLVSSTNAPVATLTWLPPSPCPSAHALPWGCQGSTCPSLGSIQTPICIHPFPPTPGRKTMPSKPKISEILKCHSISGGAG